MGTNSLTVLGMRRSRHIYSHLWKKCLDVPCFVTLLEIQFGLMEGQSIAGFFHYALNQCGPTDLFTLLKLGRFMLEN